MNLGEIAFVALVALGVAVGLILALSGRDSTESESDWLDRQL